MITNHGLTRMCTAIFGLMYEVRVRFDDTSVMAVPIHKHEIEGDTLRVIGLLSNEVEGTVTEIEVVDNDGQALLSQGHRYVKSETYGLLIIFELKLVEVAV